MTTLGADANDSVVHVGAGTVRLRVRGASGGARASGPVEEQPSKYGKWRALTLASVYLLMGVHIAHWKLNGTTLAPLELNEVMHTLELGIITAGFIFMGVTVVATLIFGRFFCSWACHILALQDLCAWLLERVRIRPKPVRSRVLLIVPPAALFYMFVWPHITRIAAGEPAPRIRVLTNDEGWASFLTDDYWRNLPDPWIAALTFAVCGFAIVYFLGSRSFCQYACPYGVAFALADRVAPGRIKLTGHCEQCGHCTAVCTSHVRVHEEIAQYGRVVDSACMKDLDCISTCPQNAITYGFARPGLLQSFRTGRGKLKYDFSLGEDALMAVVFIASLLVFRGLYDAVPFLMTLGLGGILAYAAVLAVRLDRRPNVRFNTFQLKRSGRLTRAGWGFVALAALFTTFTAHSAFIRYHEWQGDRMYAAARESGQPNARAIDGAIAHLTACDRWGLFHPVAIDEQLADLHLMRSETELALPRLRAVIEARPEDLEARLAMVKVSMVTGRGEDAAREAQRLLEIAGAMSGGTAAEQHQRAERQAEAHQILAQWAAATGRLDLVEAHLREVARLLPESAPAHYNLGRIAELRGDAEGAERHYAEAVRLDPIFGEPAQPGP